MIYWPHQEYEHIAVSDAIVSGATAICVASPTGAGKTVMQFRKIQDSVDQHKLVSHNSVRRWLLEQTSEKLNGFGIPHGIRMSGHQTRLLENVQLCSVQTEQSRVYKNQRWSLHNADIAIMDEAHLLASGTAERLIKDYRANGAVVVGYTATPLELSHCYDTLIVAGTNSELRKCKSHLPCYVFGCGEMDTSKIKRIASGEFSVAEIRKKVWNQQVFGPIIESHRRLNPELKPALGFAPGVPESLDCAQRYTAAGIPAAHIDGNDCWVDGETYTSNQDARDHIVERWKSGNIKIVWNRFVMREGLDFPWLYHLVLATPIGSLTSYIQTTGRVLRYWSDYDHVIVQDHGGNFWRHGSPNENRDWADIWKLSNKTITDIRLSKMREASEPQPIECPECGAVRMSGPKCFKCGFQYEGKKRRVIQADGTLKPLTVGELKPRRRKHKNGDESKWKQYYHRGRNGNMTFTQIEALWAKENNWMWPERSLPFMPMNDVDWFRKVRDVPKEALR